MSDQELSKHDHVLAGLMFSLQAAAMQQLGKVQDQVTGKVAVDLEQARSTIDVLEMLKAKCRTDTPAELLRALDSAVMDVQLNYMDEVKKANKADKADKADDEPTEAAETTEATQANEATPAAEETPEAKAAGNED